MSELKELNLNLRRGVLIMGGQFDSDGELCIDIEDLSMASDPYFYINKDNAKKIINHLQSVLKFES